MSCRILENGQKSVLWNKIRETVDSDQAADKLFNKAFTQEFKEELGYDWTQNTISSSTTEVTATLAASELSKERIEKVSNLVLNKIDILGGAFYMKDYWKAKNKILYTSDEQVVKNTTHTIIENIFGEEIASSLDNMTVDELLNSDLKRKLQDAISKLHREAERKDSALSLLYSEKRIVEHFVKHDTDVSAYPEHSQDIIRKHFSSLFKENNKFKSVKQGKTFLAKQAYEKINNSIQGFSLSRLGDFSRIKKFNTVIDMINIVPSYKQLIKNKIKNQSDRILDYKRREFEKNPQLQKTLDFREIYNIVSYELYSINTPTPIIKGKRKAQQLFPNYDSTNNVMASDNSYDVVKRIAESDSKYKDIAKKMLPFVKRSSVPITIVNKLGSAGRHTFKIGTIEDPESREVLSNYVRKSYITLNGTSENFISDPERLILHEVTHSLTSLLIASSNGKFDKYLDYLKEQSKILRDSHSSLFMSLLPYGFENAHEMLAEVMSNFQFQELLKQIPAMESEKFNSLFEEIIDIIRRIFGIKKYSNAYEQLIDLTTAAMENQLEFNTTLEGQLEELGKDISEVNILSSRNITARQYQKDRSFKTSSRKELDYKDSYAPTSKSYETGEPTKEVFDKVLSNVKLREKYFPNGPKDTVHNVLNRIADSNYKMAPFADKLFNKAFTQEFKEELGYDWTQNNISSSTKQGVPELFESNPELANDVYEALGFNEQVINVPNKEVEFLLHSEKLKINLNEITLEEEGEIDLNLKNKWNTFAIKAQGKKLGYIQVLAKDDNTVKIGLSALYEGKTDVKKSIIDKLLELINNIFNKKKVEVSDKKINVNAGKGIGKLAYELLAVKLKEEYQKELISDTSRTDYAENLWKSFEKQGKAEVIGKTDTQYRWDYYYKFNVGNQITPQQKQQALQLYSQYIEQTGKQDIEGFKKWNENKGVKAGVEDLFDSNPELANAVYEALGLTGKVKVSLGKELEYKDPYVSESRLKNFKKYEVLDENGKNIGTVVIEDRGNKTVILHPKLSVIGKGYGKELYKSISSTLGVTIQEWTEGAISKSDSAKAMWDSLEKEGSAKRIIDAEQGDNFRVLNYRRVGSKQDIEGFKNWRNSNQRDQYNTGEPTIEVFDKVVSNVRLREQYFPNGPQDTVHNVLSRIADSNYKMAPFAELLKGYVNDSDVIKLITIEDTDLLIKEDGSTTITVGKYRPDTGVSYVVDLPDKVHKGHAEATILHEIMHRITYAYLREGMSHSEYQRLEQLYNHALKYKDSIVDTYPLTNIDEFIVGIFTNSQFIKDLRMIEPMDNKSVDNFLIELLNYILSLFPSLEGQPIQSLFHQAYDAAVKVLEKADELNRTLSPTSTVHDTNGYRDIYGNPKPIFIEKSSSWLERNFSDTNFVIGNTTINSNLEDIKKVYIRNQARVRHFSSITELMKEFSNKNKIPTSLEIIAGIKSYAREKNYDALRIGKDFIIFNESTIEGFNEFHSVDLMNKIENVSDKIAQQLQKELITETYNYYKGNIPYKSTSQLRKEIGIRSVENTSHARTKEIREKVKKYNMQNGTSHEPIFVQIGESQSVTVRFKFNYLPIGYKPKKSMSIQKQALLSERFVIEDAIVGNVKDFTGKNTGEFVYGGEIYASKEDAVKAAEKDGTIIRICD